MGRPHGFSGGGAVALVSFADTSVLSRSYAARLRTRVDPSQELVGLGAANLTHEPPDPPDPEVTFLTGDIGEAVATALGAAGGKNLEILGAEVAGQCLRRGLVDEILVYVMPVLLGDGIRFSPPGLPRIDLEPVSSTRSRDVTILRFHVRT